MTPPIGENWLDDHRGGLSLSDSVIAQLLLEEERCEAISAGDLVTLDRLLTDGLTHTYSTGHTGDR